MTTSYLFRLAGRTAIAVIAFLFSTGSQPLVAQNHCVGEMFGGGVIFYIGCDNNRQYGLIAALEDQSRGATWGDALDLCRNYAAGGFHDWRLPTQDELIKLCAQKGPGGVVPALNLSNNSNDPSTYYWSSTPFSATHAYRTFMSNCGSTGYNLHRSLFSVRAVRSF